ncbi:MAG: hypothetical protein AAB431_00445, partial [Patescibacteria group bacterium]
LANQLGNLVGRVATMAVKNFGGELDDVELDLAKEHTILDSAMRTYDFKTYIDTVFTIVALANEVIDKKAPFKLVKVDPVGAKFVMSELAQMIRFIARSLQPIIPQTAEEILRRYGKIIEVGDPLFPRRDV